MYTQLKLSCAATNLCAFLFSSFLSLLTLCQLLTGANKTLKIATSPGGNYSVINPCDLLIEPGWLIIICLKFLSHELFEVMNKNKVRKESDHAID